MLIAGQLVRCVPVVLSMCTIARAQGDLFETPEIPTPYTVHELRVADLNGDGADDLIGLGESGFLMTFLFSDGALEPRQTLEVAAFTFSMALDDLDLDGDLDVVTTDPGSDRVLTWINDGTGTFAPGAEVEVPHRPDLIATALLDGDDLPDIVVVARFQKVAYTLLADEDGSFVFHEFFAHDERADAIHAVDFDDDGDDDILIANSASDDIRLYRNTDASLSFDMLRPTGNAESIDTGDLDGDGDPDVVVGVTTGFTVRIYLNEDGVLGPQSLAQIVSRPVKVRLVDFDFDGDVDIAAQSDSIFETYGAVTHNQGGALFDDVITGLVADFPTTMDVGDVDGDGDLDLATATENSISLLLNRGDLSFAQPATYPAGDTPVDIQATDVDLDGRIDLVITGGDTSRLIVVRGDDEAGFVAPEVITLDAGPRRVRLADLDADGDDDAFFVTSSKPDARLHVNDDGIFGPPLLVPIGPLLADIGAGDVDADGDVDLVATNLGLNTISVLFNDRGTFRAPITYPAGASPRSLELVDADADGDLDALVGNVSTSEMAVLLNDGVGTFTLVGTTPLSQPPRDIVTGDLDNDGDVDALVTYLVGDSFSILTNGGDGSFLLTAEAHVGQTIRPTLSDVNDDGLLDIVFALYEDNVAHVLLADDEGTYAEEIYRVGLTLTATTTADIDHDGDMDLIGTTAAGRVSIIDNRLFTRCAADVNDDGELDILDFVAFQLAWQSQDPGADCDADGAFTALDFVCFQSLFWGGCV